jgi:hypothetical protein
MSPTTAIANTIRFLTSHLLFEIHGWPMITNREVAKAIACSAVLLLVPPAHAETPRFDLEGRVVGEPPVAVIAQPCGAAGGAAELKVDAGGIFRASRLGVGLWCVVVERASSAAYRVVAPLFAPVVLPPLDPEHPDGGWTRLGSGPPPPSATRLLVGRVLQPSTGRGVGGAWVWIEGREEEASTTDEQGRYELPAPSRAGLHLRTAAVGRLPARYPARADGDEVRVGGPIAVLHPAVPLVGRVVDPTGAPLRAALELTPATPSSAGGKGHLPPYATHESGADGWFWISAAPDEEYRIEAHAPGWLPATRAVRSPARPSSRESIVFELRPAYQLAGLVLDPDGEPVAGADVSLVPLAEHARLVEVLAGREVATRSFPGAATDARGRFELRDLDAGPAVLVVRATGFAPFQRPVVVEAPSGSHTVLDPVVLEPAESVAGRVVDIGSDPLSDVEVRVVLLSSAGRRATARAGVAARTDAEGRFRVGDLARDLRIELRVAKPGFVPRRVGPLDLPIDDPIEIVLQPGGGIAGRVLDGRGRPVAGARLRVRPAATSAPPTRRSPELTGGTGETVTVDDGGYALEALGAGRFVVSVSADCCLPSTAVVEIDEGQWKEGVDFSLKEGQALHGRVTDDRGRPVAGAVAGGGGKSSRTAADGTFDLRGLRQARIDLWATHPSFGRLEVEAVVEPNHQVELVFLQPASLSGRVVDGEGRPIGDSARVYVAGEGLRGPPFLSVESDGAFRALVQPGAYRLRAVEGARSSAEGGVVLRPGEVSDLQLVVAAATSVSGTLAGAEIGELARAQVMARAPGSTVAGRVETSGAYEVTGLTAGSWTIVGELPDGRRAEARVEVAPGAAERQVDLVFGDGHTVEGRILLDGSPLVGGRVALVGPHGARMASALTAGDGRFSVTGLRERPSLLRVESADGEVGISRSVAGGGRGAFEIEIWTGALTVDIHVPSALTPPETLTASLRRVDEAPGGRSRRLVVPPDGRVGPVRVAEGSYELTITGAGLLPASTQVDVPRGTEVALVVSLVPPPT